MKKNKKGISNWDLVIGALSLLLVIAFSSCAVNKQVGKAATTILLKDSAVATGHIGICIYEPATNKYCTIITAAIILYRPVIPNYLHYMQG